MTRVPQMQRYCARCGTRLNNYNLESFCAPCESASRDERQGPPHLPPAFWQTDQMRDALATWHMGRMIFAYRTHPFHGRALPQELVANWLGLTQAQLSRIEKGPAPEQFSKLIRWAEILAVPPELLWFKLPASSGATLDHVNRQDFMRAALSVTVVAATQQPLLELLGKIEPTPIPSMVGPSEIEQVRTAAREFSSWDHTYGGGLVREAVSAQLRYAVNLLSAGCGKKHRRELHSAVGFLGHTAGFMAFDAYAHTDARSMFQLGLTCAEEVGDWHLRGKVLSSMARQAIWCGHPDDGLTFIELAMVRADRLTATERAMLHAARARALAKLHRTEEAVRAVGQADEEFASTSSDNDPPWMAYYDAAQHSGDTGHTLFDVALDGRFVGEARTRLKAAVTGHTAPFVRSRAISGIKLASLTMATGDPLEAASFGQAALVDAGHLRSRRAADDLRELRMFAEPHIRATEVEELRARIDRTLVHA
ncbi:helix-turn-helix domain-containing protein [Nocardia sp. 2YAB30]|uniref:helix-turn-helix domain-containing protein n=1 Tax=Nocardia sp. 2YAB30 TaxID=3233022 RepID=UPI003F9CFE0F